MHPLRESCGTVTPPCNQSHLQQRDMAQVTEGSSVEAVCPTANELKGAIQEGSYREREPERQRVTKGKEMSQVKLRK